MATSTITTVNDFVGSPFIETSILVAASEHTTLAPLCKQSDISGTNSSGIQVATAGSFVGTPDDAGAGVDTEYDATETGDISSTTFSTGVVTATVAEYGVRVDLSDTLMEDAVDAMELWNVVENTMVGALMAAVDDDIAALFSGFTRSVGSTGVDITLAQLLSAIHAPRIAGQKAPDGLTGVLSQTQCDDLEGILVSTNAAAAVYSMSADRFLGAAPGPNNGYGNGQVMWFRNTPIYASGYCDTANAGADDVGAVFVHSTTANDPFAALGLVMKRYPRLRTQRDESLRSTELICTLRAGAYERRDAAGTKVVTDA